MGMNPEIKEKWVAALRSGEYTQGASVLRSEQDKYCCLGVLCEIAASEGVIPEPTLDRFGYRAPVYIYAEDTAGLPQEVADWAGLPSGIHATPKNGPTIENEGPDPTPLYRLNDSGEYTFADIADIIEKGF